MTSGEPETGRGGDREQKKTPYVLIAAFSLLYCFQISCSGDLLTASPEDMQ
jgi:hypothetical protein